MTSRPPRLSLIVPVGPGEQAWLRLGDQLLALRQTVPWLAELELVLAACERLAVPPDLQARFAVAITRSEAGRARQLNAGAQQAQGDMLWFVHADTELNAAVLTQAHQFMNTAQSQNAVGYFQLAFAEDGPWLTRLNAAGANVRSRLFGLPFGDQTLLISRKLWRKVGSFEQSLKQGEDLDWVVRAQLLGNGVIGLPGRVRTSARKYQRFGWLHTTLRHLVATYRQTQAAKKRFRHTVNTTATP